MDVLGFEMNFYGVGLSFLFISTGVWRGATQPTRNSSVDERGERYRLNHAIVVSK